MTTEERIAELRVLQADLRRHFTLEEYEDLQRLVKSQQQAPPARDLEYWKTRCQLAEDFINKSPDDPDVTAEQLKAYQAWQNFIKS